MRLESVSTSFDVACPPEASINCGACGQLCVFLVFAASVSSSSVDISSLSSS
jgi:hypothetical protein